MSKGNRSTIVECLCAHMHVWMSVRAVSLLGRWRARRFTWSLSFSIRISIVCVFSLFILLNCYHGCCCCRRRRRRHESVCLLWFLCGVCCHRHCRHRPPSHFTTTISSSTSWNYLYYKNYKNAKCIQLPNRGRRNWNYFFNKNGELVRFYI